MQTIIDQRDKQFIPYVTALQVGTSVWFANTDKIRHHVYSFSPAKKFELPLYAGVPAEPVVFDQPGFVTLGCNIHDWMIAYVAVLTTPYFAGRHGGPGAPNERSRPVHMHRGLAPGAERPAREALAKSIDLEAPGAKDLSFTLPLKAGCHGPKRAPGLNDRRLSLKLQFRSFRSRLVFFLVALLDTTCNAPTYLCRPPGQSAPRPRPDRIQPFARAPEIFG